MTFEEEIATLQQFLRFGETKSIVELMALQDKEGQAVLVPSTRTNSDIRTFIERNTPRTTANLSTPKVDKLGSNSMHHFENFINSMAFMLPFQLLGSIPPPFMGPAPGTQQNQNQQPCLRSFEPQAQRQDTQGRDDVGKDNPASLSHPTESSLLGSHSIIFSADLDRTSDKPLDSLSTNTKIEAEDLSASDNYSDGPSTPCTPLLGSEIAQMSPEEKLRSFERAGSAGGGVPAGGVSGSSLRKGRVICNACEKTFYDKGTLKIHYNAVHLKIKHKCTIEGCNMVFSSLRSRNRHSANPNPRLHMPMNRNNRDKDIRGNLSADESSQGERRSNYGAPGPVCSAERSVHGSMLSNVDTSPKLHSSSFPSIGHGGILFPNLKTVQPVLPFYRSLVTPAELANTPGTLPSLPVLSSSVPVKPITAQKPYLMDPVPKKKSRKSSMPIKIERDEQVDKGSDSEDEALVQHQDGELESVCSIKAWQRKENDAGREKEIPSWAELAHREKDEETVEKGVITCLHQSAEDAAMENHCEGSSVKDPKVRQEVREEATSVQAADRRSELSSDDGEHGSVNGDVPSFMDNDKDGPDGRLEDYGDPDLSHFDPNIDLPHHCEICQKTFKNPFNVKLHYQNVHLKDMHTCTVEGCNAAFPSRRSRDRHSANINLHHKLLTKDSFSPGSTFYLSPSKCPDKEAVGLDYGPDLQDRDLSYQDPMNQASVIFKGHNRMGLVFPMNKISPATYSPAAFPVVQMGEGDDGQGGVDGAVLDLSTSSSVPPCGSARSSWDSDGACSEGAEEMEETEEAALPVPDSEESCDGMRLGVDDPALRGQRTLDCGGGGQDRIQGGGGGSPITCHVCQKVYSNKGTFRAHYKTVHLRLLHKCKVPGCDTSFSSVRSRNRHSQNLNLHRNLAVTSGSAAEQE